MSLPHISEITTAFLAQGKAVLDANESEVMAQTATMELIAIHPQNDAFLPPFSFFHSPLMSEMDIPKHKASNEAKSCAPSLVMTPQSPPRSFSLIGSPQSTSSSNGDSGCTGKGRRNSIQKTRQNRKDWVESLQKQMLEVIDMDEHMVRKAKALEAEIAQIKFKLHELGFNETQIADIVKKAKNNDN